MTALCDIAYSLFGHYPYCAPETIDRISKECPGRAEAEYVEAIERVIRLAKLSDHVCSDWYDHRLAQSEAMDKMRLECPGFSEHTYALAWARAERWVSR